MAQAGEGITAEERRARRRALWIALPYVSLGIFDALYADRFSDPLWLYWASHFVEHIVIGLLLLWAILQVTGWRLQEIGIGWPPADHPGIRLLAYTVVATLLLMSPVTDMLTDAMGIIAPADSEYDYSIVFPAGRVLRIVAILYLCAASSIIEEIYYRGVLWRAIAPAGSGYWRQACFVVVSAVLFGASHTEQDLYGVVSTGLWGASCAVLLLAMRSLWPLIIGHAAANLYQFRFDLLNG